MNNTAIWDALGKTDPAQTKAFNRAGGFKGTAVKPMWVLQRLTEEFGACGDGWGVGEPVFQVVPAGSEVLVYCKVSAWHGTPDNTLWGVGGDKVVTNRASGPFTDDEAFKKAFTDAVMNAFKFIGVAADVHMGRFDDNKYVEAATQDFATQKAPANGLGTEKRDGGAGSISGVDWWDCDGSGLSSAVAKKTEGMTDNFLAVRDALREAESQSDIDAIRKAFDAKIAPMPRAWRTNLRDEADTATARIQSAQPKRNVA